MQINLFKCLCLASFTPFDHMGILQIFSISRCGFWQSELHLTQKNAIIYATNKELLLFYKVPRHLSIEYISLIGANVRAKHEITYNAKPGVRINFYVQWYCVYCVYHSVPRYLVGT